MTGSDVLIGAGGLLYAAYLVLTTTARHGDPLWRSWVLRVWTGAIRPTPPPAPPRPNYEKIARLERELGLADPEPPRRPIRPLSNVCLTKDCDGDTEEFWTWQGLLATRFHHCRRPA